MSGGERGKECEGTGVLLARCVVVEAMLGFRWNLGRHLRELQVNRTIQRSYGLPCCGHRKRHGLDDYALGIQRVVCYHELPFRFAVSKFARSGGDRLRLN